MAITAVSTGTNEDVTRPAVGSITHANGPTSVCVELKRVLKSCEDEVDLRVFS